MPKSPKTSGLHELSVPPGAVSDPGSREVLRAWVAGGGLQVTLDPAFDQPDIWGLLLVDVARHAARAFAAEQNFTQSEALQRIKAMFDAEWERPTDLGTIAPVKKL